MDGQYFSLAFRERYPKFNGLIWAYHWLQVGLYEPLLVHRSVDERQAGVKATVARFWQMLEDAPQNLPHLMPMTAAVAPRFADRYPEVAIVFDNLHMMHDVVSDILTSPEVPRDRKRHEIMRAVRAFRDDTTYATTVDEWRAMSIGMGVHNQGGPAVGFLMELPTPTVPRGMSMAGMDHAGMDHGDMDHGAEGHVHPAPGDDRDAHRGHEMPAMQHDTAGMHRMMEFIIRLLDDPVVDGRIHADARLHHLWADSAVQRHLQMMRRMHPTAGDDGPAGHEGHRQQPAAAPAAPERPRTPARRPAPARPPTPPRPPARPPTPPTEPHPPHHRHR
jgi:hypothetical protein